MICVSELLLKAEYSIEVTDDGIINLICAIDLQFWKVWDPILVTDDGIVICVSDEHPKKNTFTNISY